MSGRRRLFFVLLAAVVGAPAVAGPTAPADAVEGWKAHAGRFAHAGWSYKSPATVRQGKETSVQVSEVRFAFGPAGKRIEATITDSGSAKPLYRVLAVNSRYVFRLDRGGSGWVLRTLARSEDDPAKGGQQLRDELDAFLSWVHCLTAVGDVPLVELADDLRPAADRELSLGRERRAGPASRAITFKTLSVRLDDNPFHTIRSATAEIVMNKTPGRVEVTATPRLAAGLPVPAGLVYRQEYPGTLDTTEEFTFDIDPSADPPGREFTLSAFGLPEPVGVSWEKPTRTYVWLLVAAGVCAGLAVVARYLARKQRTAEGV